MQTLRIDRNTFWLPKPNELHLVLAGEMPPLPLITTAFTFAFDGDHMLFTELVSRGWTIPGGHIDPGETPEQAARREMQEEAGATLGPLHLLGYQHIKLLGPKPTGYRYPHPEGYQLFYWTNQLSLQPFRPNPEARDRALVSPEQARTIGWVQRNLELYEAALSYATGTRGVSA